MLQFMKMLAMEEFGAVTLEIGDIEIPNFSTGYDTTLDTDVRNYLCSF